ncbi:hypothetical protein ACFL5J_02280 [Thermodesulfobacteriota bacterium]
MVQLWQRISGYSLFSQDIFYSQGWWGGRINVFAARADSKATPVAWQGFG